MFNSWFFLNHLKNDGVKNIGYLVLFNFLNII